MLRKNGDSWELTDENGKTLQTLKTRSEAIKAFSGQFIDLWMPWAPHIIKGTDENGYDYRLVYGIMSDTSLDVDKQRCDPAFLQKAIPEWYEEWGNIRAMHKGEAVGTAVGLEQVGDAWYLTSKIVDTEAIMKIDTGVYKGYSINVAWPHIRKDASAPMGIIDDGTVVETSVVDRPANSNAKITLLKAVGIKKDDGDGDVDDCCPANCDKCTKDCADCANGSCDCKGTEKDATTDQNSDVETSNSAPQNDEDYNGDPEDSSGDQIAARSDEKTATGANSKHQIDSPADEAFDRDAAGWIWHLAGYLEKAANGAKDEDERKSPPKGYPTDKSQYADPENFRYPIDEKHIHAALSYYNAGGGKAGSKNWDEIGSRIAAAATKIYGKKYVLRDGKVVPDDDSSDDGKKAAMTNKITLMDAIAIICASENVAKAGAQFSASNMAMIATAHDNLAKMANYQHCAMCMKAQGMNQNEGSETDQGNMGNLNPADAQVNGASEDVTVKSATGQSAEESIPAWFTAAMEGYTSKIAGIEETVKAIGERPFDLDSPLQTMIVKTVKEDGRNTERTRLLQKAAQQKLIMKDHTDPAIRADATIKYGNLMREIEALD